jgi:hypothetical protein
VYNGGPFVVTTGEATLTVRNGHSAAKHKLKCKLTDKEQRSGWQRTEITPVLPITGQEFSRYLVGYF